MAAVINQVLQIARLMNVKSTAALHRPIGFFFCVCICTVVLVVQGDWNAKIGLDTYQH